MTFSSDLPPANDPAEQPRRASLRSNMPRPQLTYIILGVTVAVFVLQQMANVESVRNALLPLLDLVFTPAVEAALRERGMYDTLIARIQGGALSNLVVLLGSKVNELIVVGQVWRLFTPALLHASLTHIGFNMYALYAFGTFLEPAYGRTRFMLLYILAAFGGNVLSFLFSRSVSVGASTAIFGLLGAQGIFIWQNRQIFGDQARSILTNIIVIAGINLMLGLSPGIDNWGHLGGLLAGLAFAWFAGPRLTVAGLWPQYHLEDTSSKAVMWTTALALAVVLAGLAVFGITAQ
jgi:rhomboid protease GluP